MKQIKLQELKSFDIMLEGSTSWLSQQIQNIIKEKISHSGTIFKVYDSKYKNTLYVHESDRYGLRNSDFVDYYFKDPKYKIYIARPRLSITHSQEIELMHLAIREAGHKPYDFFNLIFHQPVKFIMKKLLNIDVWWGKRKTKADKRFICSERTAWIMYNYFGVEKDWHKISTEHFLHSDNYEVYELVK